jgi:hypothetical protein
LAASALEYLFIGIKAHNKKGSASQQMKEPQDPNNELIFIIQNIPPISINNTIKGNSIILNKGYVLKWGIRKFIRCSKFITLKLADFPFLDT